MIFNRKRRAPVAESAPRPNHTRIAVLEYDLLGIAPPPGSVAAATIVIRQAGTCIEHQPVDVGTLGDIPDTLMLCTRCGNHITLDANGDWRIVTAA